MLVVEKEKKKNREGTYFFLRILLYFRIDEEERKFGESNERSASSMIL